MRLLINSNINSDYKYLGIFKNEYMGEYACYWKCYIPLLVSCNSLYEIGILVFRFNISRRCSHPGHLASVASLRVKTPEPMFRTVHTPAYIKYTKSVLKSIRKAKSIYFYYRERLASPILLSKDPYKRSRVNLSPTRFQAINKLHFSLCPKQNVGALKRTSCMQLSSIRYGQQRLKDTRLN